MLGCLSRIDSLGATFLPIYLDCIKSELSFGELHSLDTVFFIFKVLP